MSVSVFSGELDQEARDRLRGWLSRVADREVEISKLKILSGGRSAASYRIGLVVGDEPLDCVLRVEEADGPLTGIADLGRQYRLLEAISGQGIPAPRARWFCDDASVLGGPFAILDHLAGEVPNPWRKEGRLELERQAEGGRLADSYVKTLAAIHAVPAAVVPAESGGGEAADPAGHLANELARWRAAVGKIDVYREDPLLAYAEGWLEAHPPTPDRGGLSHGDYRPGNLVMSDGQITGVLDWELAWYGDPRNDLGIACSIPVLTHGLVAGLMTPEEMIQRYEEATDRAIDREAVRIFAVLSTYRITLQWINAAQPFGQGEDDLEALRAGYSALESRPLLARELGIEVSSPPAATDGDARLARILNAELREAVLPALSGLPRERLILANAVLRMRGGRASAEALRAFEEDLDDYLAQAGESGSSESRTATARFADLIRKRMAEPAFARDETRPEHARMRRLLGRAASPALGIWP